MSAPPSTPAAPPAARAPGAAESPDRPAAPPGPEKPAATAAPDAPKTDDAEAKRLSGKHWQKTADQDWPNSTSVDKLSDEFKPKVQSFLKILDDNKISYEISATLRPKQRSYLFHYCLEVAAGRVAPKEVPKETGVDINWDHGDDAKSKAAAKEMADVFGLVGVAAHPSNHNQGEAIDMKLDFGKAERKDGKKDGAPLIKYKLDGKDVTREVDLDNEAIVGEKAGDRKISNIEDRELSKAGADFGLKRQIDTDVVHWSLTGG